MAGAKGIGGRCRRVLLAVAVACSVLVTSAPAYSWSGAPVLPITFPVVGSTSYSAGFGACRDGCRRRHKGVDIMTGGWKGFPVVAALDGTVVYTSPDAGRPCCTVILRHRGGWETRYLHLDNDTPGTDDGAFVGIAPGVEVGAKVREGQIIGWVGDSGNSEHRPPHLHFEIRAPGGAAIDPYPSLRRARHIRFGVMAAGQEGAIEVARAAYPSGANVAFVVSPDVPDRAIAGTYEGPVFRGPPTSRLDGALTELAPRRLVLVGFGADAAIMRGTTPGPEVVSVDAPQPSLATGDLLPGLDHLEGNVIVVDDGRRLPDAALLDRLAATVPVQRWRVGRLPRAGLLPGGSASAPPQVGAPMWELAGGGWLPAGGLPVAGGEVTRALSRGAGVQTVPPLRVVVTRRQAGPSTLRFLIDLFSLPPMPVWR